MPPLHTIGRIVSTLVLAFLVQTSKHSKPINKQTKMGNSLTTKTTLPPLQTVAHCETAKFMGTWFVIGGQADVSGNNVLQRRGEVHSAVGRW